MSWPSAKEKSPKMSSKKSGKGRQPAGSSRGNQQQRLYGPPPLVSFRYLLGAAAVATAIGATGAYLVLCLLFYQNQAMLIFHPSQKITATPASVGLAYQEVAFDHSAQGLPQLTGWWIPAVKDARFNKDAILYLHGASGSLSEAVPYLKALQGLGINVFAIDYRGYGNSAKLRPTEQLANADALAAWTYLTTQKHIAPSDVVIMGQGAGAVFATHLASRRQIAGLVLAQMAPAAHAIFEQDARARLLPLFLLANQHLNPTPELKRLKTPKLFLAWPQKSGSKQEVTRHNDAIAAGPKQMTVLPSAAPAGLAGAVEPFLRQALAPAR